MTSAEDTQFINELLNDMDNAFWNAAPSSPISSPVKAAPMTPKANAKSSPVHARDLTLEELTQGAEGWNWEDDLLSPQKSPIKKPVKQKVDPAVTLVRPEFARCMVETVSVSGFQKELIVKLEGNKERRVVVLCDDWSHLDIQKGDIVSIVGSWETIAESTSSVTLSINITSRSNLLVHHPDILLTPTALSSALQCRRKPLLAHLVRNPYGDVTPALIWGNMLHVVVQSCLASGQWGDAHITRCIDEVVSNGLLDLVKLEIGVDQAKREIHARAKGLRAFAQNYISSTPKASAVLTNTRATRSQTALLALSEFYGSEEDIWSPEYGLKGKIDAVVEAIISENLSPIRPPVVNSQTLPFEIKTGKTVAGMEHRAQTMLYALLIGERYGVECPSGLLYYTQSEEVVSVPVGRNEIRGLMIIRNEIAAHMVARSRSMELGLAKDVGRPPTAHLPSTIDDERICKRCNVVNACMLYRKAVERVDDMSSPIADTYAVHTSHLTDEQSAFFRKWEALISLEEQDLVRFKKELWTMGAIEREKKGRCFGSMLVDRSFSPPNLEASNSLSGKIHRFTYKFLRSPTPSGTVSSLLNGHLGIGDAITVSVEPHLLAYAQGFIVDLTQRSVTVGIDHDLDDDVLRALIQRRTGIKVEEVIFRIDKDELFAGMSRIRGNLAQLFYADGDTRRLELVVDLKRPEFDDSPAALAEVRRMLDQYTTGLNSSQQEAIIKALTARNYALILGMPGTGKTSVIATITKLLVAMGKTVLLASYTHSAVDSILLKLKEDENLRILRIGNIDKVHPDIRKFTISAQKKATSVEQIEEMILTPPIVATTCLSLDNPLFSRRTFDYCIVDEASQATLPTCIGPLRYADKFILVGDHFQLPPMVRNPHARKGGLDISLFRRLSEAHPHAAIDLVYQYRMNKEIMTLSNELIYNNRLMCASGEVESRSLKLPNPGYLQSIHNGKSPCRQGGQSCWLDRLLSESCKAIFVDTDLLPARDSKQGDLVQNETEASLVFQLTEALLHSGIQEEQIGVISLYRQQIKLLSHLLAERKGIEILTADKSQGRDKECVIISLVRSNDAGQIGDLVKDWRRMNVSFTRAKSKLVLFGSRKTLESTPLLEEFFKLMDLHQWMLKLPPGADKMHLQLQPSGEAVKLEGYTPESTLKRSSEELGSTADESKENLSFTPSTPSPTTDVEDGHRRPSKRTKPSPPPPTLSQRGNPHGSRGGFLRGRHILQDLVNDGK
ncbi:Tripartite DNA replication factor [Pleurotus pulmonarius]|nr:Tripartite DNA replication factor [Pleurotus pulmonarius]